MLLEMKSITKTFGSVVANDNISLHLNKGEVLAVVGENGAGKSTLMKILYGLQKADEGEIYKNGKPLIINNPQDAINNGIGMVQQHFMLFDSYKVWENIVYGNEPRKKGIFLDVAKAKKEVENLSEEFKLEIDLEKKAKSCPVGIQQRIEILKVLYQDAEIIIFDEPTAVLTPKEIEALLETMRDLVEKGKSIILITHKLQEVMDIADRVFVMRNGKFISDKNIEDTNLNEISHQMVGRDLLDLKIKDQEHDKIVLNIEDLTYSKGGQKPIIDKLNLNVKSGEIVGIAGVSGNGQSELIQIITGILKADEGRITLDSKDITNKSVRDIRDLGLACIPEDRYLWGCAKDANLSEVGIMGHHRYKEFEHNGLVKTKEIDDFTRFLIDKYSVKTSGIKQKARELSGGNLQKLIVAREIEQKSKFLLVAEPTRGVDIGAKEFIHEKLIEKRAEKDAILLISSELSEIMSLSDRIYVMYDGKINGEFTRESANADRIGFRMLGGKEDE